VEIIDLPAMWAMIGQNLYARLQNDYDG